MKVNMHLTRNSLAILFGIFAFFCFVKAGCALFPPSQSISHAFSNILWAFFYMFVVLILFARFNVEPTQLSERHVDNDDNGDPDRLNVEEFRVTARIENRRTTMQTASDAATQVDADYKELSIKDKKSFSGKAGEQIVLDTLGPILADGWELRARNHPIEGRGDVDFILISPNGIGFSIDAKHSNRTGALSIYYEKKKDNFIFVDQWFGIKAYPVERAKTLAKTVKSTFDIYYVVPVLCCTPAVHIRRLKQRNGFCNGVYLLSTKNLINVLYEVERIYATRRHEKAKSIQLRKNPYPRKY